jgi:hypothetical protein
LALILGPLAALMALGGAATAEDTHTYSVTVTIAVDRAAGKIGGEVISDAPAQFCEMSTVRVRRAMPGKDKVVARIFPSDVSTWSLKPGPGLKGAKVYAETSEYHLPSRPIVCLAARSRAVTAP